MSRLSDGAQASSLDRTAARLKLLQNVKGRVRITVNLPGLAGHGSLASRYQQEDFSGQPGTKSVSLQDTVQTTYNLKL